MIKVSIHIRTFSPVLGQAVELGYSWQTATSYREIPDDAAGLADHLRDLGIPSEVADRAQGAVSCGDWFTGRIAERPNGTAPSLSVRW